jgi:ABC-type transport system involved in multi-copper enzyme maturation permease subunit
MRPLLWKEMHDLRDWLLAGAALTVASERHGRTLDFLLVRPVSPGLIVWSKFLAGSVVLAALLSGIVALGFADPGFIKDTGLRAIREQVSFAGLLVPLLPRFWFLYALTLLFSVLVDRSLKAAALAAVVVITAVSSALAFADLAPFSGFVYWLPFFESTGGLVEAIKPSPPLRRRRMRQRTGLLN